MHMLSHSYHIKEALMHFNMVGQVDKKKIRKKSISNSKKKKDEL